MSTVKGFDYRTGLEREAPLREWRAEVTDAVVHGARRRVENNETFVHGRDGTLLFEVYANVSAPKGAKES